MQISNLSDRNMLCLESYKSVYSGTSFDKYFRYFKSVSSEKIDNNKQLLIFLAQIAKNKISFITESFNDFISNNTKKFLVINVSPGTSPLSIKLLTDFDESIFKILEIDNKFMEEKQEVYDVVFREFTGRIKCIGIDKYNSTLATIIELIKEYYKDYPVLLICDGTMYSDVINEIKELAECLKSNEKTNVLLIDYVNSEIEDFLGNESRPLPVNHSHRSEQLLETIKNAGGDVVKNMNFRINFSQEALAAEREFQLSLWKI